LRALISAAVFGLGAFILAACANYIGVVAFPSRVVGLAVAVFTLAYAWFLVLVSGSKAAPKKAVPLETVSAAPDIRETIRIRVLSQDGTRGQFTTLATSRRKMVILGNALINKGMTPSIANLCGSGKPFGRSELDSLRDEFMSS
jgi:hypothetical protein